MQEPMKAKLLHLTRWLRGLGTCQDCGGPTIGGKCPACLQGLASMWAEAVRETGEENKVIHTENRQLSRRLMVFELIAEKAKAKATKSP